MNSKNPLHIFSKNQLDSLNQESLKRLKKEILLEFQLTNDSTIILNGYEIDKNGILKIFDDLDSQLQLHVFIYKNVKLNAFLNDGNMALLRDNLAIQKIKNVDQYKDAIEQKIVSKLQPMITELVMKPKRVNQLITIQKFVYDINPDLVDDVYSKAYVKLKSHLDYLNETYDTPFSNSFNTIFNVDIRKHVNVTFYNSLVDLPSVFNPLKRQYGLWCNNNVLYEAFNREAQFDFYDKEALYTLRDAAKIASNVHNKKENLKIARDIQQHIKHNVDSSKSSTSIWKILFIIFIVIKLIALLS